jgi:hypothetical protein
MNDALEIAPSSARWWRDFGNDMVFVGIVAEILIEAFLKTASPQFTPTKAHRRERRKIWAALAAGLVVASGIGIELRKGDLADDISDQISRAQQSKIDEQQSKLIAVAKALRPRQLVDMNREFWRDDVGDKYPGLMRWRRPPKPQLQDQNRSVYIQAVSDFETQRFSEELEAVLNKGEWLVTRVDQGETGIRPARIQEGVAVIVLPLQPSAQTGPLNLDLFNSDLVDEAKEISNSLTAAGFTGQSGGLISAYLRGDIWGVPNMPPSPSQSFSKSGILIEIGANPVTGALSKILSEKATPP